MTKTLAQAIFDEIERHSLAREPITLSAIEGAVDRHGAQNRLANGKSVGSAYAVDGSAEMNYAQMTDSVAVCIKGQHK